MMKLQKIARDLFSTRSESKQEFKPKPDPKEIFQSGRPVKKLIGRKVAWELSIDSMNDEAGQNMVLVLASYEGEPANVWITVDVTRFPEISSWPAGSLIAVKGEISAIQGKEIYLNNCSVEFLKESDRDLTYQWFS